MKKEQAARYGSAELEVTHCSLLPFDQHVSGLSGPKGADSDLCSANGNLHFRQLAICLLVCIIRHWNTH